MSVQLPGKMRYSPFLNGYNKIIPCYCFCGYNMVIFYALGDVFNIKNKLIFIFLYMNYYFFKVMVLE